MRASTLSGIGLFLLMTLCFAVLDTSVKYLGAFLPVMLLIWCRYAFQGAIMGLWLVVFEGRRSFRTGHPRFQVLRGLLLLTCTTMSFFGLQYMPVAEFTAVGMLSPVVVTVLAGWVLKERVSPPRWMLVTGGFVGALIIIRPGGGIFGWAALFPMTMALAFGSFQVLTARLAPHENPLTTHFYTGLVGVAVLTPLLTLVPLKPFEAIGWVALTLLVVMGILGTMGHLFLIMALGRAPATALTPFIYAQIAFAVLVAWLVFSHVPDSWTVLGMTVIALSGTGSVWLNVREDIQRERLAAPSTFPAS